MAPAITFNARKFLFLTLLAILFLLKLPHRHVTQTFRILIVSNVVRDSLQVSLRF